MPDETSDWIVFHNARCSKSREALELLQKRGISPRIVDYLKNPLSEEELKALLVRLGVPASEILRTKEPKFSELDLDTGDTTQVIAALARHPELMERPIVVRGNRAVIARPPERLLELL